jgi:hypothetical protein
VTNRFVPETFGAITALLAIRSYRDSDRDFRQILMSANALKGEPGSRVQEFLRADSALANKAAALELNL